MVKQRVRQGCVPPSKHQTIKPVVKNQIDRVSLFSRAYTFANKFANWQISVFSIPSFVEREIFHWRTTIRSDTKYAAGGGLEMAKVRVYVGMADSLKVHGIQSQERLAPLTANGQPPQRLLL